MAGYKVGYFVGSLATKSINRLLAKALMRVAPPELQMTETTTTRTTTLPAPIAARDPMRISTGGRLLLVGLGGGALQIKPGVADIGIPMETRVVVPFWGTRAELAEVIALARAGRATAHIEQFPLAQADKAYDKLKTGALNGRGVIVPGSREPAKPKPTTKAGAVVR